MKILLAVDGSSYTAKAVDYICNHLDWFKGVEALHLLYVKTAIPSGFAAHGARSVAGDASVDNYYREEAEIALRPAEEKLGSMGLPFQSAYLVGDIADQVNAYVADNGIDLIVMGSHGHNALTSLVMGSVTTKVMATSKVPVMVVR